MKEKSSIMSGEKSESPSPPMPHPEDRGAVQDPSAPQPEENGAEQQPPEPEPGKAHLTDRAQVHVAPNLLDLATGRAETLTEAKEAREQRDLNQVVHSMLIVGLVVSTISMLTGIALEIARHQDLPSVEPDLGEVLARVLALRPSGFLALGLLVLLATPMLRVLGSIVAFAFERDWRFVGITFIVFLVVLASILLGRG